MNIKSSLPLTAKYRPQLFAEVAGQAATKTILSRAAAEGKVAPAYLFSGTRGVGKTTIARIFAKALNCERGPGPEPCNECESCRQITQGIAVDVQEIDGASNRGIDDAKRLKEDIGYAPLEGRFKIFIIDEAHMLTREAFNALLKTLEEPPARVTFILATTEPHKFPATIISRCQHFTFKQLAPQELKDHLNSVLSREGIEYDDEAVGLLARRAAGSVRDGMSLLGQVLALGQGRLSVSDVQNVLGLAGQDIFFQIIEATFRQDPLLAARVVEELLGQGVDMGFFLRELTLLWRNLFMLRQAGEKAFALLNFSQEEGAVWLEAANSLPVAHIHANWQLTLEGQRRVLQSLEPGQALELLLLNIAMLPSLIPVSGIPGFSPASGGSSASGTVEEKAGQGSGKAALPVGKAAEPGSAAAASVETSADLKGPAQKKTAESIAHGAATPPVNPPENAANPYESDPSLGQDLENNPPFRPGNPPDDEAWQESYGGLAGSELSDADMVFASDGEFSGPDDEEHAGAGRSLNPSGQGIRPEKQGRGIPFTPDGLSSLPATGDSGGKQDPPAEAHMQPAAEEDVFSDSLAVMQWEKFIGFCQARRSEKKSLIAGDSGAPAMGSENLPSPSLSGGGDDALDALVDEFGPAGQDAEEAASESGGGEGVDVGPGPVSTVNPALLNKGRGAIQGNRLVIECPSDTSFEHLCRTEQRNALSRLAGEFCGRELTVEILPPRFKAKTRGDLRREAQEHPVVLLLKEKMGAYLLDCLPEHE